MGFLGRIPPNAFCHSVRYLLHARTDGCRGLPKNHKGLPTVCPGVCPAETCHIPSVPACMAHAVAMNLHGTSHCNGSSMCERSVQGYGFACGLRPHAKPYPWTSLSCAACMAHAVAMDHQCATVPSKELALRAACGRTQSRLLGRRLHAPLAWHMPLQWIINVRPFRPTFWVCVRPAAARRGMWA